MIELLVVTLAALLSAVLGTVESAVTALSRARVEELVKEERQGAAALLKVLNHRSDNINLLILLRTLLDTTAAVVGGALALELIGSRSWAIAAAVAVVATITYVIAGVFSRTVGRRNPYTVSIQAALVLSALAFVLGPITKILVWIGGKLAPGPGFEDGPFATELELREMVDLAQDSGVVESEERQMIQNVFDLADTTARSVMVPRPEMIWIEDKKTAGQATALCVRSGHSRIPVVGETVDDIQGIVYLKDLVQQTYHATDGGHSVKVKDIMRPATFVPDSKPLDDLLHDMQLHRNHIAILIDEYGGVAGLISIEDILEEIVGDIADEYDVAEQATTEELGDGRYRVVARLSLDDVAELLDIEFPEDILDQVDTIGGLLAYELGRVPLPGVTVESNGLKLTSEGTRDRRGRLRTTAVVIEVP